jgi:hypothetical protein
MHMQFTDQGYQNVPTENDMADKMFKVGFRTSPKYIGRFTYLCTVLVLSVMYRVLTVMSVISAIQYNTSIYVRVYLIYYYV